MGTEKVELINRGRGLQLSTIRVTVQDLVPYFQERCTHEEIRRWIPDLTEEEITVVEQYYHEHRAELDEEDRQIRERNESRKNPEWVEKLLALARVERLQITQRLYQQKSNGNGK
jgi:uncharacterized protein (DUF433 family)